MSKAISPKNSMSVAKAQGLPAWYSRAFGFLVGAVFVLIALGGAVRTMKAGLACPDWPLCFGRFIPDYHPQVYFEFIHRVVAGSVAILAVGLMLVLFRSKASSRLKVMGAVALMLLAAQIVFGGLTVILLLKANVVATHREKYRTGRCDHKEKHSF